MLCCEYIMFAFKRSLFHWARRLRSSHAWYRSRSQWLYITGARIHDRERERERKYSMDGSFSLTFSLLFVLLLLLLFLMTKAWFFNGYSPTPCGHLSNDINSRAVRIGPIYMTKLYMTQCKLRPTFEFQGTFGQFWFNWHHYCTIWLLFFYIYVLRDMCDQKNVKRSNG